MNKFLTMLIHTYSNRVKSKSFLITTLATLVLIFTLSNIQTLIETFSGGDAEKNIAVVTEKEQWVQSLQEHLVINDSLTLESYDGSIDEAQQSVEDGVYTAVLELEVGKAGLPQAMYYANQIATNEVSEPIRQALQQLKVGLVTERADIAPSTLEQISAPVSFELVALEESAKTEEELNQTRGIVYVMLFFMYFAVMMYGNMIATDVATEKSSRVMEILISSVSPVSQMFAKIIGIALLGLTQFGLFVLVGYLGVKLGENSSDGSMLQSFGLTNIEPTIIVYAFVFFILGYLLYATLAATLGSLVSRLEDAQQIVSPMMMLVVAGFLIAMFGLNVPDAAFITVSSYIPFFTPLIMFLRVGMLDIPTWEIVLSFGILVVSIVLLGLLGARIYRGGVLMYGKSSSLKDLKKAMQLSKKER